MEQLSLPYRIALVGLLVFALAWFTVLRPGTPSESAPQPAAAARSVPTATPTAAPSAAAPAPRAARSVATPDAAAAILGALADGKTAVVLFHGSGGDDAQVQAATRRIDRRNGRVVVTSVPIAQLGRYGSITRGVEVTESPTLVVIGPNRRARTIVGYTDTGEIDQLVADVTAAQRRD